MVNAKTTDKSEYGLCVLVLPEGAPLLPWEGADNSLGLDVSRPVVCDHILQVLQLQELMDQELVPACEIVLAEADPKTVLAELDGVGGRKGPYSGWISTFDRLEALGAEDRIRAVFTVEEMIPPVSRKGSLSVETSERDTIKVRAENAFLAEVKALCQGEGEAEASVFAEGDEESLELWGLYFDGATGQWWTDWIAGDPHHPEDVGREFAAQITSGNFWAEEDGVE
ncbi:MAG: hypothetical protein J6E42_03165 [Firmicutes bacterium]|nr:hypothetical protein [Bacillota bacterium]